MAQLLNKSEVTFDLTTACVVVGAGACGLIAALRLSDAGVETIVLERDTVASGSTSMSSGFIPAAGTQAQKAQSIDDSATLFAADIQKKANNEANPDIVKAVTTRTAEALDWLSDVHGLQWLVLDDFLYPGHSTYRMHAVPQKTGSALHDALLGACSSAGIDIVTQARVDALIIDDKVAGSESGAHTRNSSICGVRAIRPDGQSEHIKASAVVLACNGYGANTELMHRFIPHMAKAHYHGHAGNTGDALLWGEQLQVSLLHTTAYQGHGSLAAGHNILITWALMMEGGVQVNTEGLRFSNEHAGYSEQAEKVMQQPGSCAWNIYDQRLHQLGMEFPDYQQANAAGAVKYADSVESLVNETGIDASALKTTVREVIAMASNDATDEFGRQFNQQHKLMAPYYAIKVTPAVFHTQGGVTIDKYARVLGPDGLPISHLLAAGGAACGVSGSSVAGYLSGNGLLTAVGLGFIAADTVIQELLGSGK